MIINRSEIMHNFISILIYILTHFKKLKLKQIQKYICILLLSNYIC